MLLHIELVEEALCFGWIDSNSSVCPMGVMPDAYRHDEKEVIGLG